MNLFTLDTGWQSFPSPGPKTDSQVWWDILMFHQQFCSFCCSWC